mmetsp:Transcript_10565/g.14571  ORF Transcript_10565/g.14571 Transcript_10565/m.14571 type:complete len:83 (+) Transcript_10565:22-270(+)
MKKHGSSTSIKFITQKHFHNDITMTVMHVPQCSIIIPFIPSSDPHTLSPDEGHTKKKKESYSIIYNNASHSVPHSFDLFNND